MHVHVPSGAASIENDISTDRYFRDDLEAALEKNVVEAYYGLNDEPLVSSQPSTGAQKTVVSFYYVTM